MARTTLSARLDALEAAIAALTTTLAQAPAPVATAAPAKANTFYTDVIVARAKAKVPCAIAEHKGICNRTFSPRSTGVASHQPRVL